MLVTMKCPSCGANLEIDNTREFMFCQYCGTKIANIAEKVEVSGTVTLDNSSAINNLLQRGYEFERAMKIDEAIDYYNKVLDLQYDNKNARQGIARCNMIITAPNVFISFNALNNGLVLQTSIDNGLITKYRSGSTTAFTLPLGKHTIKFRIGAHRFARAIMINDRNTKIYVRYTQDGRNHIDISF
ncbi:MAG: zinc ribbon domain-containing protein [Ruminococcus sp.]|nr:zinc ribbon domain-containing protein [Ruminococcus sp.]